MFCHRLARSVVLAAVAALGLACASSALAREAPLESVPFDSPRWRMDSRVEKAQSELVDHLGRPSLKLQGASATLRDVVFSDGIVEFDMAFGEERAFGGLVFRFQDDESYEHFYVRPHQSGRPDSIQYMPVFHGVEGWQLYHGEGYTGSVRFPFGEWLHVRVVLSGNRAEVSLGGEGFVLRVRELKRGKAGGALQLRGGSSAPFYFSRFAFRSVDSPLGGEERPPAPPLPSGTVAVWSVSEPFSASRLEGSDVGAVAAGRESWSPLASDEHGTANLARLHGRTEDRDTTFARLTVHAERPLVRPVRFGYSDRARVYLNGKLLYSGDNTYRSRDFRYLGTIGLFDSVPLRLEEGENELLFAVSESFGGWGIQAQFPDASGIRWEP